MVTKDDVVVHGRLTRIETLLEESTKSNEECHERIEEMLDHILQNDKEKLERINQLEQEAAVTKTKLKNVKVYCFLILTPLAASVVKWFV